MVANWSYWEAKRLLTNAVRWAAGAAAPVEIEAPLCVEVTAWEQAEANRRVIHLVNVQSDIGRTITIKGGVGQATRENLHVIQEILPVHDLVVRFQVPAGKAVNQIALQPDGISLSVTRNGAWAQVTVPMIEVHGAVVIEWA